MSVKEHAANDTNLPDNQQSDSLGIINRLIHPGYLTDQGS